MRESHAETTIPASGGDQVPYKDNRELVNGTLKHMGEIFIGEVLGAGGTGGDLLNVPFEPGYTRVINAAGATPAVTESIYGLPVPAHVTVILAAAIQATPPVITKVGDGDFTVALPVALAPDGETVAVICYGARDVAGGL